MDTYTKIFDYIDILMPVGKWPEAELIIKRCRAQNPPSWSLPITACEAVGGDIDQAISAAAAIGCMQISIILIDDMLDKDPRGEYHNIGEGAAANLASAFQAGGLDAINKSAASSSAKLVASQSLNRMMLVTALGQHMDFQPDVDEEFYWEIVRTKSSPFFGASFHIGALLGNAPPETASKIEHLGRIYGEMIQIHDDLNDAMATPANPDWVLGRFPLPILFAQSVNHPDKERFIKLRKEINDPGALEEVQSILIRSGAVSYCVDQLLYRWKIAQDILGSTPLKCPEKLSSLINQEIDPVKKLFGIIGSDQPDDLYQPLN